jgi:hypothetical protein
MPIHYLTVSFAILLLVYHQVTTWLPLYPWNDTSTYTVKELLLEAGTNGLLMGTAILCLIKANNGFYHYYPLFYYPFLLSGVLFQWWLPYFSGKFSQSKINFDYEVHFAHTTKFIPRSKGKRTPDANHIVLHIIAVAALVLVFIDRL